MTEQKYGYFIFGLFLSLLRSVFVKNKKLSRIILFGSRAKGTAKANSDIDLAVWGLETDIEIEALVLELGDLPLPYKFDVKAFETILNNALRSHIKKAGLTIYTKESM